MNYQIWDTATRNLIDEFKTDSEAVAAVQTYLSPDEHGRVIAVALVVYDEAEVPVRSIHGDELAALVRGQGAEAPRRSA